MNASPRSALAAQSIAFGLFLGWTLLLFKELINFPQWDDFNVLLEVNNAIVVASSLQEKVRLLFSMHDVHFHLWPRLSLALMADLLGGFNFRVLALFGLAFLLLIILLLASFMPKEERPTACLLSACLLCHPSFYECFRATTVWAYLGVMTFVLLSLLAAHRRWHLLAGLLAVAAGFCIANGSFAGLCIGVYYWTTRRRVLGGFWILISVAVGVWQFSLQGSQGMPETRVPFQPLEFSEYFFSLVGSGLGFLEQQYAFFGGVLLVLISIGVAGFEAWRSNPRLFSFLVFLYASALSNALGRFSLGVEVAYGTSRYALYSLLIIVTTALLVWDRYGKRIRISARLFLSSFGLLFCFACYLVYLPDFRMQSQWVRDSQVRWTVAGDGLLFYVAGVAPPILTRAEELGVLPRSPASLIPAQEVAQANLPEKGSAPVISRVEHVLVGEKYLLVDGWAFAKNIPTLQSEFILEFSEANKSSFFVPARRIRPDVSRHHLRCCGLQGTRHSGFFALIPRERLTKGKYILKIHLLSANRRSSAILRREVLLQ